MDLMRLSFDELRELRAVLGALDYVGDVLVAQGFEPVFDLSDGATVVRCGPILGSRAGSPRDEPALVEDCPAPEEDTPVPCRDARGKITGSEPAPPAATSTAASNLPPVRPREVGADGLVRGSWLPDEDRQMRLLHARGLGWAEIGAALNRPATAVTFRARKVLGLRIRQVDDASPSPAPEAVPDAASDVAPAPAPEAARVPEGDSVAVIGPGAGAADGFAPPDLSGEARDLWHVLGGLERDPAFDAEADFDLVDGLARGGTLGALADELGVAASVAGARFRLLTEPVRDSRGRIRIDGQQALLRALKARMIAAREQAA